MEAAGKQLSKEEKKEVDFQDLGRSWQKNRNWTSWRKWAQCRAKNTAIRKTNPASAGEPAEGEELKGEARGWGGGAGHKESLQLMNTAEEEPGVLLCAQRAGVEEEIQCRANHIWAGLIRSHSEKGLFKIDFLNGTPTA